MEEQEKAAIDRNYDLLINNIILTDEFYNQLRWNQVLPESMIADVQVCHCIFVTLRSFAYS